MTEFKPQGTTMGTFDKIERELYEAFVGAEFTPSEAKTIAHSFTQYMLGYITEEGVARYIVDSGADPDVARGLAQHFKKLRDDNNDGTANPSRHSQQDRQAECISQ